MRLLSVALTTLLSLIVARYTYKRLTDISLADVRGPGDGVNDENVEGASWMAGDIPTLFTDTTGTLGARWASAYGAVCKLRAQIGTVRPPIGPTRCSGGLTLAVAEL